MIVNGTYSAVSDRAEAEGALSLEDMMFWISGVWDPSIKHKLIGFAGIMALLGVAYVGSLINGTPFFVRLIF